MAKKKEKSSRTKATQRRRDRDGDKPWQPPTSGALLGRLVEIMRLREHADWLEERSTRRALAGERVSPDAFSAACAEVARAMISSEIITELPEAGSELEGSDGVLRALAAEWDAFVAVLSSDACLIRNPQELLFTFARLIVIDFVVRSAALKVLYGESQEPEDDLSWLQAAGISSLLKRWLAEAEDLTVESLASQIGSGQSTVSDWLYKGARPRTDADLEALATVFAQATGREKKALWLKLRRHDALAELARQVRAGFPDEIAEDLATGFARLLRRTLEYLRQRRSTVIIVPGASPADLIWCAIRGARAAQAGPILASLWDEEPSRLWRADLITAEAATWSGRLQQVARAIAESEETPDEKLLSLPSVTMKNIAVLRKATVRMAISDLTRQNALDRRRREQEGWVTYKLPTNNAQKATNRHLQASEAEREGRIEDALVHRRRAVELMPEHAEHRYLLGALLGYPNVIIGAEDREAALDEARLELQIAAQLKPRWDKPVGEFGVVLFNLWRVIGDVALLEGAAMYLEHHLDQVDPTEFYWSRLGRVRSLIGDHAGAVRAFDSALKLKPNCAMSKDWKAESLWRKGKKREAKRLAREAAHSGRGETLALIEAEEKHDCEET